MDGVHDLVQYEDDPGMSEVFQSIPYTLTNGRGTELSPLTGQLKGAGDCEELSALLFALCRALGIEAQLVWLDQPGARRNHITTRVRLDGRWLWAETSVRARLGEHPYEAVARIGGLERVTGSGLPVESPLPSSAARGQLQVQSPAPGYRYVLEQPGDLLGRRYLRPSGSQVSAEDLVAGGYLLRAEGHPPLVYPEPVTVDRGALTTVQGSEFVELGALASAQVREPATVVPCPTILSGQGSCDLVNERPGWWWSMLRDLGLRTGVLGVGIGLGEWAATGSVSWGRTMRSAVAGSLGTEFVILVNTVVRRWRA
jgi:hypothetical protein